MLYFGSALGCQESSCVSQLPACCIPYRIAGACAQQRGPSDAQQAIRCSALILNIAAINIQKSAAGGNYHGRASACFPVHDVVEPCGWTAAVSPVLHSSFAWQRNSSIESCLTCTSCCFFEKRSCLSLSSVAPSSSGKVSSCCRCTKGEGSHCGFMLQALVSLRSTLSVPLTASFTRVWCIRGLLRMWSMLPVLPAEALRPPTVARLFIS